MSIDPMSIQAGDVMHAGCMCIDHDATLLEAARHMAEEAIGAMPICGPDGVLVGMLTDRDIVVHGLAAGLDPATTTAGELASGRLIWTRTSTPVLEVLAMMEEHLVRRIPIMDEDDELVGVIAQGDIATHLGRTHTGELLEVVSGAPPRQSPAY